MVGAATVLVDSEINAVAISPDGKFIVSGGEDKTLRLWNVQGQSIGQPFLGHQDVGILTKFRLLLSCWKKAVSLIGFLVGLYPLYITIGKPFYSLLAESLLFHFHLEELIFKFFLTCSFFILILLDFWRKAVSVLGFLTVSYYLFLAPSENLVLPTLPESFLRPFYLAGMVLGLLWLLWFFRIREGAVTSVAFSPDGRYIVSGGTDGTVRLWNLRGRMIGIPFLGHTPFLKYDGAVTSVAFSPDGRYIASGGEDRTVRLWNLRGQQICKSSFRLWYVGWHSIGWLKNVR